MARRGGTRRALAIVFVLLVAAVFAMLGVVVWLAGDVMAGGRHWMVPGGIGLFAVTTAWIGFTILDGHFDMLERLRGAVLGISLPPLGPVEESVAHLTPGWRPPRDIRDSDDEAGALAAAIDTSVSRLQGEERSLDRRLAAILESVSEPILVITENGQVSLVNQAALDVLGDRAVRVGMTVFNVLDRGSVVAALAVATADDTVRTTVVETVEGARLDVHVTGLAEHGGVIMVFGTRGEVAARRGLRHDLTLHDQPPRPASLGPELAMAAMPVVVLDLETTGLDIATDRVISVGAVRLHGRRLYRNASIDLLVNPGRPIPPASTRIHGISDDMVAEAPSLPQIWPEIAAMLDGCAVVGHNIGFDVAMLRCETELAGLPWRQPVVLDTLLLYAALKPQNGGLDLETVCDDLGVDVHGRHTALGDALVTAEVWLRLLPLMEDIGIRSLGEAQALARTPTRVIELQKQAGW